MRTLNYKLADGTIVKGYQEAVASGQKFTEVMREVRVPRAEGSDIRELCLELYGAVTPERVALIRRAMGQAVATA